MIGKNRRVVASILSLAVMASALPMSGVFAVEDTARAAATGESVKEDLFYKNLSIDDLLYIEETELVSKWNESFAKHIASLEARGYDEAVDMTEYQEIIDIIKESAGEYAEIIQNIFDNAEASIKLENGVFTVTANVTNLSQLVNDKLNEKIEEAAGEYADELQVELKTSLDMDVTVKLDTTALAETKTVSVTYAAVDAEGNEYTLFGMADFAKKKVDEIAVEFSTFCDEKVTEAEGKLDEVQKELDAYIPIFEEAKDKLASAKADFEKAKNDLANIDANAPQEEIDKAQADIDAAEKKLADAQAEYDSSHAQWEDYNKQVADARATLADAEKRLEDVDSAFADVKAKVDKYADKLDNYLEYNATAEGATADEAYSKLYEKVQNSSKVPADIKAKMPATLAEAVASENFATLLGKVSNVITPADVQNLLDGASSVKLSVANGIVTMSADVYDAELDMEANKTIKIVVDASNAKEASEATFFMDITRKELKENVSTSVTDTSSTDESNSDVTTVSGDESGNGSETTVSGDESGNGSETTVSGDESGNGSETTVSGDESGNGSETTASGDESGNGSETTASGDESGNGSETTASGDESGTGSETTVSGDESGTGSETDETDVTPSDEDSLWDKALKDTTGKFRAGILGDMSLDFDIKAEEQMKPADAISSYDALVALQCVVGMETAGVVDSVIGDVDYDGKITSYDALLMLQYTVKSIDGFEDAAANKAIYVAVELDDALEKVVKREYYTISKVTTPIDWKPFGFDVQ